MSDAKPLTVDEASNSNQNVCGDAVVDWDRLQATAQALEAMQHHYDAAGPEHNLLALLDLYESRTEKAESERDAAKTKADLYERDWYLAKQEFGVASSKLRARIAKSRDELEATRASVAEMAAALEACEEWMCANPPADGWGLLDKRSDADRHDLISAARAALEKGKGGGR